MRDGGREVIVVNLGIVEVGAAIVEVDHLHQRRLPAIMVMRIAGQSTRVGGWLATWGGGPGVTIRWGRFPWATNGYLTALSGLLPSANPLEAPQLYMSST